MDPEKHEINMGLKNMSAFREFNKKMCNGICSLKVCVLTSISKFQLAYATIKWKWMVSTPYIIIKYSMPIILIE